jgi:hypothetical protein
MSDGFDEFDQVEPDKGGELVSIDSSLANVDANGDSVNIVDYRDNLVKKYHKGNDSLVEKLRNSDGTDSDTLLEALVNEIIQESDHLLGNELVATESGDLRYASVISYKRTEVIEKAVRAVMARQKYEKESGIDVDSPSMIVIFKFFMQRVKDTFDEISLPPEQNDMFFNAFGNTMENWKKELREEFEILKSGG